MGRGGVGCGSEIGVGWEVSVIFWGRRDGCLD